MLDKVPVKGGKKKASREKIKYDERIFLKKPTKIPKVPKDRTKS